MFSKTTVPKAGCVKKKRKMTNNMIEPIEISRISGNDTVCKLFRRYGIGSYIAGKIKIHPLEALYLMEKGKITVDNENFDSLMKKTKKQDALAEKKYAILKYLRQNGYIVRPSFINEPWLRIYRKGFRPGEDRTQWLLKIVGEKWNPKLKELFEDMKKAAEIRKELVYAFVRKDKVLFFKIMRTNFD